MIIHHLATNLLLLLSVLFSVVRIGIVVLYLHDISDVLIDVAKMCNFLKLKLPTAVTFIGMMGVWGYYRMWFFPNYVIRSAIVDTEEVGVGIYGRENYMIYRGVFVSLLVTLLGLHVYWFGLFCEMARLLAVKFETHDLSVHKDGEEYEIVRRKEGGENLGNRGRAGEKRGAFL